MSFLGADTDQVRGFADRTASAEVALDELLLRLDTAVHSAEWVGPDAEAFRQSWDDVRRSAADRACRMLGERAQSLRDDADEQDSCSDDRDGSGSRDPGDPGIFPVDLQDLLDIWIGPENGRESDGFFGDLLGGPESGYWGNLGWSGVSIVGDIMGLAGEPTGGLAISGMVIDAMSAGIGLYDAGQSFQDGDPFGTFDGLVTAGVNLLDIPAGVLSAVPYPPVKIVGEGLGIATGAVDLAWSSLTGLAQASAIAGGPGDGSTSRFLLEAPGWALEQATGYSGLADGTDAVSGILEDGFGWASEGIRDAVPIIDPILDLQQGVVENIVPGPLQQGVEGFASDANDWIRDKMPW